MLLLQWAAGVTATVQASIPVWTVTVYQYVHQMEVLVAMLQCAMEPITVLFVNVHLACQAILKLRVCFWVVDPIQSVLQNRLASIMSVWTHVMRRIPAKHLLNAVYIIITPLVHAPQDMLKTHHWHARVSTLRAELCVINLNWWFFVDYHWNCEIWGLCILLNVIGIHQIKMLLWYRE